VNKWGIIDDDNYPIEKPANEYRIVVVGDSFTAGVTNTVRWPALLQEKLNQSSIWRQIVKNRTTRVINLGRDGIGLVQFDKVLLLDGLKFTPDLILVNFIADDVIRKPYFRGTLGEMSPQQRDQYARSIADKMVSRLPWFTIYPEVLAMLTRDRLIPTRISGRLQVMNEDRIYSDKDQAVAASIKALRNIFAAHRNVRVMLHPQREDFEKNNPHADVLANFERGLSDIHIEHMISRFPPHPDATEFDSWFIPNDGHQTDKGVRIYAQLVANYLLQGQHSTAGPEAGLEAAPSGPDAAGSGGG
jgi:hypothetical protein